MNINEEDIYKSIEKLVNNDKYYNFVM